MKNTEFIECVSSFKDIKNELHKKYKEIDKLKANYMANIELAEDAIHKYYMKQNTKKKNKFKIVAHIRQKHRICFSRRTSK